ncbi:MAG TPA: DUF6807 family protein, partial [Pirellulaceae bacterium]
MLKLNRLPPALGFGIGIWLFGIAAHAQSVIELDRMPDAVGVRVNGALFTRYVILPDGTPVVWPIHGPSGQPLTRSFPLRDDVPGETRDHPHHRSLWFAHGDVNGLDFWTGQPTGTRVKHVKFTRVEATPLPMMQ